LTYNVKSCIIRANHQEEIVMAAAVPALLGTVASTVLGKLMEPKQPKLPETKTAPTAGDDAQTRAKLQRAAQRKYAGAGREGTALSIGSKLG
jgi:hypothetical protein